MRNEPDLIIVFLFTTYRRPRLLESAIACFERQDYPRRELLILDDAGQIAEQGGDRWRVRSVTQRYPSLPAKYNALLEWADDFNPDALCVWEDDDVYLPWHLSAHVATLAEAAWSHPSRVWSDYGGTLHLEPSAGRFHGALAMRASLLRAIGGWPDTLRADFDQQLLGRLAATGIGGDPCRHDPPSYVFRWASTGAYHGQAWMRGPDDTMWWSEACRRTAGKFVDRLVPRLDASAAATFAALLAAI